MVWSVSLWNPQGQERPRWAWNRVTLLTVRKVPEDSQSQKRSGWRAGPAPRASGAVTCLPVLTASGVAGVPCCLGALLCFRRGIERSRLSHADRWVLAPECRCARTCPAATAGVTQRCRPSVPAVRLGQEPFVREEARQAPCRSPGALCLSAPLCAFASFTVPAPDAFCGLSPRPGLRDSLP